MAALIGLTAFEIIEGLQALLYGGAAAASVATTAYSVKKVIDSNTQTTKTIKEHPIINGKQYKIEYSNKHGGNKVMTNIEDVADLINVGVTGEHLPGHFSGLGKNQKDLPVNRNEALAKLHDEGQEGQSYLKHNDNDKFLAEMDANSIKGAAGQLLNKGKKIIFGTEKENNMIDKFIDPKRYKSSEKSGKQKKNKKKCHLQEDILTAQ